MLFSAATLNAQSSNGTITVVQDVVPSGAGRLGGGNPMSLVTTVGEPSAGAVANATTTVWLGYHGSATLPAGTRTITVQGTVNETVTSVTVNGFAATLTGTTFVAAGIQLVEDPNAISATAVDLAGNSATRTITVYLDTHPPARPTAASTSSVTTASSDTLTGTKTPGTAIWINGAQVVALNDNTTWTATVSMIEGDNVFVIVAKDAAGNASTSKTVNIVLDTQPPVVTFTPPAKTNFNPVALSGALDDSLTTVTINGLTASRNGQVFDVSVPLSLGANTLALIATSPNGYVTVRNYALTLGTVPSIVTVQPTNGTKLYANSPATIQITATDQENDPIQYQVLLDGAVLADWSSTNPFSWNPTLSHLGPHTITTNARDSFGSSSSKDVSMFVLRKPVEHP